MTEPDATAAISPTAADLARWGLDPSWARRVTIDGSQGRPVDWHVLDTGPGPRGTVVCVHGNPTWGYLWRDVLRRLSSQWRVVAVDQTNMGWSERTGPRRLAERVDELVAFCRQETAGPLVLMAHDWGGPIAVGAAAQLPVQALVLANTAVAKPEGVEVPPLIATARRMVDLVCRRTPAFVAGTAIMTAPEHREALRAPYRGAHRREAVAHFVADIPLGPSDPSWAALNRTAETLDGLEVPVLLVWGGRDPVFHDRFLADLLERAPHADVHRFPRAGHLVPLDEPMGDVAADWLDQVISDSPDPTDGDTTPRPERAERLKDQDHEPRAGGAPTRGATDQAGDAGFRAVTAALAERSDDTGVAYRGADGSLTWAELAARSDTVARHLLGAGLARGDRVALLVPPSGDMLVVAYGIWKAGGALVVADAGLGPKGLRSALRGATPSWVVGTRRTLLAARLLGLTPGARRASLDRVTGGVHLDAPTLGAPAPLPVLRPDDVAAVVHTSGATGPAKPVRYRHEALAHQRDVVGSSFAMTGDEAFTTSFAPFVLLGPALGVPCVLPDIDVTRPGDLDVDRLAAACEGQDVGVAWLSPASARRIVETADGCRVPLRLVMLAGAPIDADLARGITAVTGADVRAPYGMTEVMPVTDGTDATRSGPLGGTATGWPLIGAEVLVVELDDPDGDPLPAGQWGELLVAAPWMRDGYDRRWRTDSAATVQRGGRRFHRTGDVGYRDDEDRLFQLGRLAHVVWAAPEPLASVAVEQPIAEALGRPVAAVGVGPRGTQVLVIVVDAPGRLALADSATTDAVRAAAGHAVAAVLSGPLPVDVRHRSKVDRSALAAAADTLLAGR